MIISRFSYKSTFFCLTEHNGIEAHFWFKVNVRRAAHSLDLYDFFHGHINYYILTDEKMTNLKAKSTKVWLNIAKIFCSGFLSFALKLIHFSRLLITNFTSACISPHEKAIWKLKISYKFSTSSINHLMTDYHDHCTIYFIFNLKCVFVVEAISI